MVKRAMFSVSALPVLAVVFWVCTPPLADIPAAAADPQGYVDRLGIDRAALVGVSAACWLTVGWLALGLGAVAAARLPGRTGRLFAHLADRTLPAAFRQAAAAALGVSVLSGAGAALVTGAGGIAAPVSAASTAITAPVPDRTVGAVSLAGIDWPVGRAPSPGPARSVELAAGRSASPVVPRLTPVAVSPDFRAASSTRGGSEPVAGVEFGSGVDWPAGSGTVGRHGDPLVVTVRAGDCLWTIAAAHLPPGAGVHAIERSWPRWYAANRALIGADPNLIYPGQQLVNPG